MNCVNDIDSFYDFLGYVVIHAPDRFPIEDYLAFDKQMNLEKAFNELRLGFGLVDRAVADENKLRQLSSLLDEPLLAYRSGNDVKGAHLLQDIEALIFKKG